MDLQVITQDIQVVCGELIEDLVALERNISARMAIGQEQFNKLDTFKFELLAYAHNSNYPNEIIIPEYDLSELCDIDIQFKRLVR